ncbi:MAG: acyl carrier protein [Acidimicrobiales bacterium]
MSDVPNTIREHVRDEFLQGTPDVDLADDLNLIDAEIVDSLGIMLLVDYLQDRFDVVIGPEEVTIDNFETIAAITTLVEGKLAGS